MSPTLEKTGEKIGIVPAASCARWCPSHNLPRSSSRKRSPRKVDAVFPIGADEGGLIADKFKITCVAPSMRLPSVATHHLGDGLCHDLGVQPERPVIYVLAVELYDFLEVVYHTIAVELPESGQSGFDA
jgi:hypothetical protein